MKIKKDWALAVVYKYKGYGSGCFDSFPPRSHRLGWGQLCLFLCPSPSSFLKTHN